MISFWVTVCESDVESFCSTILLPEYMSHLRLAPFRFADQPYNADGRQALIATYVGEGRLEEFPIHAVKHAIGLLRFIVPEIEPTAVSVSSDGAIWAWDRGSSDFPPDVVGATPVDSASGGRAMLRLFFHPVAERLGVEFPPRFDSACSYVSVSRRELFIGHEVIAQFFAAWIARFFGRPIVAFEPVTLGSMPVESIPIAGGVALRYGRFGGELSLENDTVFADLLVFSGLERSLHGVRGQATINLDASEIRSDARGITLPLFAPST